MKTKGFTLIEVLVAMAIFALAGVAVLKSATEQINSLGYLEEKALASMVADNQLTLMMLQKSPPRTEKKGKTEMAGRTWYWTIKPTATAANQLRAIDLLVSTSESRNNSIVSVRTYVPAR